MSEVNDSYMQAIPSETDSLGRKQVNVLLNFHQKHWFNKLIKQNIASDCVFEWLI